MTKDVDMKFTNKYEKCRLQVLVIAPNLIPSSVDVVIGDYLYERKFKVEVNRDEENPEPMDMDANGSGGANGGASRKAKNFMNKQDQRDTEVDGKNKTSEIFHTTASHNPVNR